MHPRVSILDFDHPVHSVATARLADRLGFHRYWVGEHHNFGQCPDPLLLATHLAATTHHLRVGSGGVCLDYHSVLRVAESAALAGLLAPGRLDLGLTRGLSLPPELAAQMHPKSSESFAERVKMILDYLVASSLQQGTPSARPAVWILGTGHSAAKAAGQLGVGFCLSLHHADPGLDPKEILDGYRQAFERGGHRTRIPETILVVGGICAPSDEVAHELAQHFESKIGKKPGFQGGPGFVNEHLRTLVDRSGTDELMVLSLIHGDLAARLEMLHEIARGFGLPPQEQTPALGA